MSSFRMPTNLVEARTYVEKYGDTQLGVICKMFFHEIEQRDAAIAWFEQQRVAKTGGGA